VANKWPEPEIVKDLLKIMGGKGPSLGPLVNMKDAYILHRELASKLHPVSFPPERAGELTEAILSAVVRTYSVNRDIAAAGELLGVGLISDGEVDAYLKTGGPHWVTPVDRRKRRESKQYRLFAALIAANEPAMSNSTARTRQRAVWAPAMSRALARYLEVYLKEARELARRIQLSGVPAGSDTMSSNAVVEDLPAGETSPPDRPKQPGATSDARTFPRERQLRELNEALDRARRESRPCIIAITGGGGWGKTTLAKDWANKLVEAQIFSGYFPPIDLRGYTTDKSGLVAPEVQPAVALERMLAFLKVEKASVPADLDSRAALFRDVVAERDVLLILDNALGEKQLRPLLPERGHCVVIITSRSRLRWLDVKPGGVDFLQLPLLDHDECIELLRRNLGQSVDAEIESANKIARYCCGLPLALRIVATLAKNHKIALDELYSELNAGDSRLAALNTQDPEVNLRHVLKASYDRLDNVDRRAFRLLGLRHPHQIDAFAVALLSQSDLASARKMLENIEAVGLLERHDENFSRFRAHDLTHEYARDLIMADEMVDHSATFDRLLNGYYGCVNYAFDLQNRNNPMVDVVFLDSWCRNDTYGEPGKRVIDRTKNTQGNTDPNKWLEVERDNLMALTLAACSTTPPRVLAPHLAFSLFYFLETHGYWTDWEAVSQAGYGAAKALDDEWAQARLLRNLGRIEFVYARDKLNQLRDPSANPIDADGILSRCARAIELLTASKERYANCPDHAREAPTVPREIADTYLQQAKLDRSGPGPDLAIKAYEAVKDEFERGGYEDMNPIASLSVSLSEAYRLKGKLGYERAHSYLDIALNYPAEKNPRIRCYALLRKAELYFAEAPDEVERVIATYDEAIDALEANNNRLDLARTLATKGRVLMAAGRASEAYRPLETARSILADLNSDELAVVEHWLNRIPDG
jgi:hypothetical protein